MILLPLRIFVALKTRHSVASFSLTVGGTLFAVGQGIERRFYTKKYNIKDAIVALNKEIESLSAELAKEDIAEKTNLEKTTQKATKRYVKNPFWGKNGPQVPDGSQDEEKHTFERKKHEKSFRGKFDKYIFEF